MAWIQLAGVVAPAVERCSDIGQGALQHTGDVEEAHRADRPTPQYGEKSIGVRTRPLQGHRPPRSEPLEELVRRPCLRRQFCRLQGDGHDRCRRWPPAQHDLPGVDGRPSRPAGARGPRPTPRSRRRSPARGASEAPVGSPPWSAARRGAVTRRAPRRAPPAQGRCWRRSTRPRREGASRHRSEDGRRAGATPRGRRRACRPSRRRRVHRR